MNKILGESLVSIIVPIYNVENYLEDCLNSILSQSYSRIEIILVEDRSTDGSLLIAESYASQDSRIVLLQNASNGGVSFSRNVGISVAKGDYIVFVDSDDYVSKDYVLNLLSAALEYDVDLVLCSSYTLDNASGKIKNDSAYFNYSMYKKKVGVLSNTYLLNYFSRTSTTPWGKLFKRDIIIKNNILFPSLSAYEDNVFYLSYLVAINSAYIVKDDLYFYRTGISNSLSVNRKHYKDILKAFYSMEHILVYSGYFNFETRNNMYEFNFYSLIALLKKASVRDLVFLFQLLVYLNKIKHVRFYSKPIEQAYKQTKRGCIKAMLRL